MIRLLLRSIKAFPHAVTHFGSLPLALKKAWLCFRQEGVSGIQRRVSALLIMSGSTKPAPLPTDDNAKELYRNACHADSGYKPKVSVIVPNYNHEPYLRERLDSIYNQSYKNIEVILLDDCSSDSSISILKEFASKFPELTVCVFNEANSGGVFNQWEKGLSLATGDLIWIAESDDFCSTNLLEELTKFFSNQAVMLAFCRSDFVSGKSPLKKIWDTEGYLSDLNLNCWKNSFIKSAHWLVNNGWAIKNIVPNVSSAVFRHPGQITSIDKSEWKQLRLCGDWIFYLALIRGGLVGYTPEAINYYRQHASGTSINTQKNDVYYREHEIVTRYLLSLYRLESGVLERKRKHLYQHWVVHRGDQAEDQFSELYDANRVAQYRDARRPNLVIATHALIAGGGETFPLMLANLMKHKGYGVTLLNCHQMDTVEGVRNMLDRNVPLLEVDQLDIIGVVFRDLGIEIVHSHYAWVDVVLSTMLSDTPEIRQVVTTHGMYEMMSKDNLSRILPILRRRVDRFVYIADKNLSPFTEEFIKEKNFVKIENALAHTNISAISRSELGISPDDFVLCLVSRAIPEKGWEEAIQAVELANRKSDRRIILLLIGDGAEYVRLKSQDINTFVRLLGYKSNPRDFFSMADMGFLPSRFKGESFPLVLIECLYAGRPMLASNVGEIGRMLSAQDGLAGDIFELNDWEIPVETVGDMIARIASDGDHYHDMLSRVSSAATKFDPYVMADKYGEVYQNCLSISY